MKLFAYFISFLLFASLASALVFTPKGDINQQGRYAVRNVTNITFKDNTIMTTAAVGGGGANLTSESNITVNNVKAQSLNQEILVAPNDATALHGYLTLAASTPRVITLSPGQYNITQPLVLRGGDVVDCRGAIIFTGWAASPNFESVFILSNNRNILRNCDIQGGNRSITIYGNENVVENNQMRYFNWYGIFIDGNLSGDKTYYNHILNDKCEQDSSAVTMRNLSACVLITRSAHDNQFIGGRYEGGDIGIWINNSIGNSFRQMSLEKSTLDPNTTWMVPFLIDGGDAGNTGATYIDDVYIEGNWRAGLNMTGSTAQAGFYFHPNFFQTTGINPDGPVYSLLPGWDAAKRFSYDPPAYASNGISKKDRHFYRQLVNATNVSVSIGLTVDGGTLDVNGATDSTSVKGFLSANQTGTSSPVFRMQQTTAGMAENPASPFDGWMCGTNSTRFICLLGSASGANWWEVTNWAGAYHIFRPGQNVAFKITTGDDVQIMNLNATSRLALPIDGQIACAAATKGRIYYNTTVNKALVCNSTAWVALW